ncbi:MAG: EFR1 family ferrodoxin [Candidatus Methanomethylophilaceae archaeon]|nr:EFR1 family ferrodoxin [Candidatus Methanomethylophilaceae archaeon]
MICYFSATGNSKYVAQRISSAIGEDSASIEGLDPSTLSEEKIFGLVTPVYYWALPRIVSRFLEQVKLNDPEYVFLVITYGTTTGACRANATKILSKNGVSIDAAFDIRMPDTWTPMFNLSDPQFVAE